MIKFVRISAAVIVLCLLLGIAVSCGKDDSDSTTATTQEQDIRQETYIEGTFIHESEWYYCDREYYSVALDEECELYRQTLTVIDILYDDKPLIPGINNTGTITITVYDIARYTSTTSQNATYQYEFLSTANESWTRVEDTITTESGRVFTCTSRTADLYGQTFERTHLSLSEYTQKLYDRCDNSIMFYKKGSFIGE